ncbi:MAG: hypothetical protein V4805_15695 [Pseudomonadota bacterium]
MHIRRSLAALLCAMPLSAIATNAGVTARMPNPHPKALPALVSLLLESTATYSISATVSGLGGGKAVVLQNSNNDQLSFSANTVKPFAIKLAAGANYTITVKTQPSGQTCSVAHGSGIMPSSNVNNVTLTCMNNGGTSPKLLTFLDFENTPQPVGSSSYPGWTIGAQGGGTVQVSTDTSQNHQGSKGSLKAIYPLGAMGMYAWAEFDLVPTNTRDIYVEFDVKIPSDSNGNIPGSAKFFKIFGQNVGQYKYANTTFGLSGDQGQVGRLTYIGFGDGFDDGVTRNIENDIGNVILLGGDYPQWIGRSYTQGATVYNKGTDFSAWNNTWHHFKAHAKFNTAHYDYNTNTCLNEINDGEYYLEIDGVKYVDAKGLFNRHCSNYPIDHVKFFDWGGGNSGLFTIYLDNIRVSTGGFMP